MASVVAEIIASIVEVAAVAGEVAAESAAVAEEAAVVAEISECTVIVTEELEEVAGVEIEAVIAETETAEISEVIASEVEEITSTEIEAEVESSIEEEIVEEAAQSRTGSIMATAKTIGRWIKRLTEAYIVVDIVGKFIYNLIHPQTPPSTPLTKEQKARLDSLLTASNSLGQILQSWQLGLKPLMGQNLGQLKVEDKGKEVTAFVTDTVDGLLSECSEALDKLKPLTTSTTTEWNEQTINGLYNGLYKAILPLEAIGYLKTSGRAPALALFNFPIESDCKMISAILQKDFDMEAKKQAIHDVQACITQAVKDQAKAAAVSAATQIIKPDVEAQVKKDVNARYVQEAQNRAKNAAQSAAKKVANSYEGQMIAYALIPIYGIIKVHQMEKEVKKKAKAAAQSAAKKAVSDYMNSTEVKNGIKGITKGAVKDVYNKKQDEVEKAAQQASKAVIKKALKNL